MIALSRIADSKITDDRAIVFSCRYRDYIVAHYTLHGCGVRGDSMSVEDLFKKTLQFELINENTKYRFQFFL